MKIYTGNRMALIVKRDELPREYVGLIAAQTMTEGIMYRSINFVDGKPVGGQGMTGQQVKQIMDMASKAGLKIEDPITIN